jgi:hypothetical protein
MICPNCHTEYRDGYSVCADCNVDLVDVLPYDQELEDEVEYDPDITYVEILRTGSLTDITMIKSLLDGEDIDFYIKGESMTSLGPIEPMRLMVAEDQIDQVTEILKPMELKVHPYSV